MNKSNPNDLPIGRSLLNTSRHNKGSAFTLDERQTLGLRGLLPACVSTQLSQIDRSLKNIRRKAYDIERYVFLMSLLERNEQLFYRLLAEHIEELSPIVYTPTVGLACQEFSEIFRHARGFYILPSDRGDIESILDNWPDKDVKLIVVTDGQRILGLGDLGANGMGIPIGKLALYCAGAGISPEQCMPVMLDVGTNNERLRNDPLYLGVKAPRLTGEAYFSLVDEFMHAVQKKFSSVLVQFEDFLSPNAYQLLETYRNTFCCFNDDIQGTAAMALAGVYASCRITGSNFSDLQFMFLGAGSAATGIASLIQKALEETGLTAEQARQRLWFVDQKGLLVIGRDDLAPYNLPYAKEAQQLNFISAIKQIKPHVLIGATGSAGTFTQEVVECMASQHKQPVIFALSNPTSNAECTAEQAYQWSNGQAIFAGGSPFKPVTFNEKTFHPSQGNNVYIFPGVGLGVLTCKANLVRDSMFLAAAKALADAVSDAHLSVGAVYPPLSEIREVSIRVAIAVIDKAYEESVATMERPENIEQLLRETMYLPDY